jgi:hypothetical protein
MTNELTTITITYEDGTTRTIETRHDLGSMLHSPGVYGLLIDLLDPANSPDAEPRQ